MGGKGSTVNTSKDMNPSTFEMDGEQWTIDSAGHDEAGNVYLNGQKMSAEDALRWAGDLITACQFALRKGEKNGS